MRWVQCEIGFGEKLDSILGVGDRALQKRMLLMTIVIAGYYYNIRERERESSRVI